MKTHDNHILRGGLKMKKNRATKIKPVKIHSLSISQTSDDADARILEEEARIYRESVMHQPEAGAPNADA